MAKNAMYSLTYGLFVLTAQKDGKHNGCIINTAGQVTTDPNQITIAVNKSNYTHDLVLETRKFTVSVISQNADFSLFRRFGFRTGREADKFDGFDGWADAANGTRYITAGTNAYISAWVTQTIDLGTHTLFIATVTDSQGLDDVPSTTYEYYLENIKPKPEAVGVTEEGKVIWRCRICGYEYEGDPIPDDFICPVCKHPASDFERIEGQAPA